MGLLLGGVARGFSASGCRLDGAAGPQASGQAESPHSSLGKAGEGCREVAGEAGLQRPRPPLRPAPVLAWAREGLRSSGQQARKLRDSGGAGPRRQCQSSSRLVPAR